MKIPFFFLSGLMFCFAPIFAADGQKTEDMMIVLGERVGPIKKGAGLADLQKAFGAKNVEDGELPGPEGTTMPGAWVYKGTDKELQVVWEPESKEKKVFSVIIIGKDWQFSNGLKLGATLEDVEKANGGPFELSGFDWDYGGWANFEGGKLNKLVAIRFYPTVENYDPSLSGDKGLKTTDPLLRAAKPTVSELMVMLQ